tara:strand:- start:196 stop:1380 length:1185 start_codon:yes stop_codon:yes gene_type:complete
MFKFVKITPIKLFFLIPIILLFLIIRIFIDFRIGKIISKKIGHMTTQMEIYICEKKDYPNRTPVIWFFEKRIANQFLKKKWSQKLFVLPRHILEPIYILLNKYKIFNFFLIDISKYSGEVKKTIKERLKQIDEKNVLLRYKPSIEFNNEERQEGENYLKKIGFQNKKFFTFASRTSEFHNEKEESIRNSNIDDKILGIKFLVSKGYKAIRMGKNETKRLNFSDSNIIDYGISNDRSDFLDIYLSSQCEFIIASSTGITELGTLFRKPKLVINEYGVHAMPVNQLRWMILLKKVKNINTGKLISFEEIYEKKLNYIETDTELNKLGYSIIDNNKLEIKKASENFFYLVKGDFDLDEILQKQKKYWEIIEKYFEYKNKYKTIICPEFYKNNIDLFC